MLQVRFCNLLPSEALVGMANDAYRALREQAGSSYGMRCHVTITTERRVAERTDWFCVQVELIQSGGTPLRVLAEGADAARVVRSGMAALNGVTARTPVRQPPARYAAASL